MFIKMLDTLFRLCYNENEFEVLFIFASDREQGFVRKRAEPERGGRGAKGEEVMPIVLAPLNQQLKIVRITADDKLKKRLESLGITVDGEITVLSSSGGSVVVKIKDGRIALDSNLSTKIFVA